MESSLEFSNSLNSISSLPAHCRTFKVIVIGDSGVGKTCLTHRFCAGEFPCRTEATIGVDFCERLVDIDGEKIKLQLWDTAGQERFRKSMVPHYYRSVHAVLFVYDVASPASFQGLSAWIEECRQNSLGQDIPRFLVGNKVDLRDPRPLRADGQVSREKALKFAEAHNMSLFETSAKNTPKNRMCVQRGARDKGRNGNVPYQDDNVEAMVMAVAAKVKRLKRNLPVNAIGSGSFKVSPKKTPEKYLACTC